MIVVANWRLDNTKSPAAMLQEKTARTPHPLRVAGGSARPARSHAVRTYVHTPGRVLILFLRYAVCTKEKAQHGTGTAASKTIKKNEKIGGKKDPRPLSCNNFLPDWNTLHRSKKKKIE